MLIEHFSNHLSSMLFKRVDKYRVLLKIEQFSSSFISRHPQIIEYVVKIEPIDDPARQCCIFALYLVVLVRALKNFGMLLLKLEYFAFGFSFFASIILLIFGFIEGKLSII